MKMTELKFVLYLIMTLLGADLGIHVAQAIRDKERWRLAREHWRLTTNRFMWLITEHMSDEELEEVARQQESEDDEE